MLLPPLVDVPDYRPHAGNDHQLGAVPQPVALRGADAARAHPPHRTPNPRAHRKPGSSRLSCSAAERALVCLARSDALALRYSTRACACSRFFTAAGRPCTRASLFAPARGRSCCNPAKSKPLCRMELNSVGDFCVRLPTQQDQLIQSSPTGSVSILPTLCGLPFQYFSDARLTAILYPTLLAGCYRNGKNAAVLRGVMNVSLLTEYVPNGNQCTQRYPTIAQACDASAFIARDATTCHRQNCPIHAHSDPNIT